VLIKYQNLIYLESKTEQQTHQNLSNSDLRAMYIYHMLNFLAHRSEGGKNIELVQLRG